MLPLTPEQDVPANNEGDFSTYSPLLMETDSLIKSEEAKIKINETGVINKHQDKETDHGLTLEEATAFDELTSQLKWELDLIKRSSTVQFTSNGETIEAVHTQNMDLAIQPARPKRILRNSLERNLALLDSSELTGNYWKVASFLGPNRSGRPKRAKAGANMITPRMRKLKFEEKPETPIRSKLEKTKATSKASTTKTLNTVSSKSQEEAKDPDNLITNLNLITVLATAFCVPGRFESDMKFQSVFTECKENQERNYNLCLPEIEAPAERDSLLIAHSVNLSCDKKNMLEIQNVPSSAVFTRDYGGGVTKESETGNVIGNELCKSLESKRGRINARFNRAQTRQSALKFNGINGLTTFEVMSPMSQPFYFHTKEVGICERILPLISHETVMPSNLYLMTKYHLEREDWIGKLIRQLKLNSSLKGHRKLSISPFSVRSRLIESTHVILDGKGFMVAFVEFSSEHCDKPNVFGSCLTTSTITHPWLTLPAPGEGMEWLFYELPDDIFTLSGIWLMEIRAFLIISDLLHDLKFASSGVVRHKFSCSNQDLKGPDYVTLVSVLPHLIIYGPVSKDCVIREPPKAQEYYNWVSKTNSGGHGFISAKRSLLSTFAHN